MLTKGQGLFNTEQYLHLERVLHSVGLSEEWNSTSSDKNMSNFYTNMKKETKSLIVFLRKYLTAESCGFEFWTFLSPFI